MTHTLGEVADPEAAKFLTEVRNRHGSIPEDLPWYCVSRGHTFRRDEVLIDDGAGPACPECHRAGSGAAGWDKVRPERWVSP